MKNLRLVSISKEQNVQTNELSDLDSSIGIAPTRDCTHFLQIELLVAEGGFYSYYIYIHQGKRLDKERKIV